MTGPLRIPAGSDGHGADQGYPPTTLSARARGPVAQPPGAEGETSGLDYSGAGTWYVEVNLEQFTGAKQRAELPLRVELTVSGTPTSAAGSPGATTSPGAATPGGRPPATTTAPPPHRRPAHPRATTGGSGDTTGVGTGTLVLAGAVGLLAGTLLGALTAITRRRRPAAPPA